MSRHRADTAEELESFYLSILTKLRKVAKRYGYALGVHGSLKRDLDIIATPWSDIYVEKDKLAKALQFAACGIIQSKYQWEAKPNGRYAISLPICWSELKLPSSGHLDLSVVAT